MSADLKFLEEILLGLSDSDLEWAGARIRRIKAASRPEIIARKTIIRKR